jgi:glycosyltransferase involved in cell wall biosynthesis
MTIMTAEPDARGRVWICSYLGEKEGAGVERFVQMLSDLLSTKGRVVKVANVESLQVKFPILYGIRYYVAWKVGRYVMKHSSVADIVICSNFFSWNIKRCRSAVIYHGTEIGRYLSTRTSMSFLRNLVVRTIGSHLDSRTGRGKKVIAVSGATKEEIERNYNLKVDRVIPNAVDLTVFRPRQDKSALRLKFGLPRDKFLILFVGTPDPRKGLGWIVSQLMPRLPDDCHLVARSGTSLNAQRMTVVPRLTIEKLADLYGACDCLVFPTRYEGCSFTLVEALASGLPVVTSRAGSGKDLLIDDVLSKYTADKIDVDEYVGRIIVLKDSQEERRNVAAAARQFAEKNHGLEAFNNAYLALIEELERIDLIRR